MYMSSSIDMLVSSDSLPADSTDRPYPKNESSSASSQSLGYSSKTFHFDPAQFGALSRGEVNIGVRPQPPPISSVDSLGYSARSKFASESPSIRTGTFAPIRSGDVLDGKSMRTGIFEPIPSGDVFDGESDVVSDDVAPPPDGLEEHPSSLEMFETTENESQNWARRCWQRMMHALDLTPWLMADVSEDEFGHYFFEKDGQWTARRIFRHFVWNPVETEFSSLQQFVWACGIGVFWGCFTALWKYVIESCVDFVWVDLPGFLKEVGLFTELDGSFPLPLYMVLCPTIFGAILSYIFAALPQKIPGQNEWITNLHKQGIQEYETFWTLLVLATAGMASGLSLGPELPLVLTAGMFGSWIAKTTQQTLLSSRIMNITAASAAVGGFFGFPMAGALFVLEVPHRMGLQYFEALSPATTASVLAVLVNRMATGNDVTGYYTYPFLTTTLPSHIFTSAVVYGVIGALIGTIYVKIVLQLKGAVHDWFHVPHHDKNHKAAPTADTFETDASVPTPVLGSSGGFDQSDSIQQAMEESTPLNPKGDLQSPGAIYLKKGAFNVSDYMASLSKRLFGCSISHEPSRAAVAGAMAGALVGLVNMFVPHVAFWGEAQLQNMIDKGLTPLPVFGAEGEPTSDMTAWGYCMVNRDANNNDGFGIGCSGVIAVSKILVTGLSLGTGIIGGHFWGPLFTAVAASHFFTDLVGIVSELIGTSGNLAAYPCVVILCFMGSVHVVTFRAHLAIMLVLTLTISAFDPENGDSGPTAGDYSAVFPLLVVAVSIAQMLTRDVHFYGAQRNRGDIVAKAELSAPAGREATVYIENPELYSDETYPSDEDGILQVDNMVDEVGIPDSFDDYVPPTVDALTQDQIEREFQEKTSAHRRSVPPRSPPRTQTGTNYGSIGQGESGFGEDQRTAGSHARSLGAGLAKAASRRLDELLAIPMEKKSEKRRRRQIKSMTDFDTTAMSKSTVRRDSVGSRGGHRRVASGLSSTGSPMIAVKTSGRIDEFELDLTEQIRVRTRSSSYHRRLPSLPRIGGTGSSTPRAGHSRKNSAESISKVVDLALASDSGGLSIDEIHNAMASIPSAMTPPRSSRSNSRGPTPPPTFV